MTPVPLSDLPDELKGQAVPESDLPTAKPETTLAGIGGAITRGLALPAAGATLGAAVGAPLAGVGAIPGAIAGAGAATLAGLVGDPIVGAVNSMFGTKYTMPTDAMEDFLTRVGVPMARSEAERIIQTAAAGAGGGGGTVAAGRAIQTAAGTARPTLAGVGQMLATAPRLQVASGAGAGAASQTAQEAGYGTAGQLAAGIAGGMAPLAPAVLRAGLTGTARQLTQKNAIPSQAVEVIQEPTVGQSLQTIKAVATEKLMPEQVQAIRQTIVKDPTSVEVVKYRLSGAGQVLPDAEAAETIKQGWKDGVIASIKASSPEDKKAMTKMLNIYKLGQKSERFRAVNRPSDILGNSIESRIDSLANFRKQSGQEIGRIAENQLKGTPIDVTPAMDTFINDLGQIGVKVEFDNRGVAKAVLQGSDIQGDKAAQRLLNGVLERLSKVSAPDAYGVHTAKRFIDTQVSYGKKNITSPLTAQAERVVKNLRRNLNQTLGELNSDYSAANTKFADSTQALDSLQKSMGTSVNFDDANAAKALGTAARKITSNYASRANMLSALDQANATAQKYGAKFNDDVINQAIFVNELDRMFGAAADTSLKGQMEQAAKSGLTAAQEAVRGGGGLTERAINLAAAGLERARGINEENAIKAMEKILARQEFRPK